MLHPLHSSCPPFLIYCLWWMPLYFFVLGHLFTELFIVLLIDANLLINYFPTLFSLNKDSKFLGFNSVSIRAYFWSPKHACLFQRTENMVSLDSKIDPPYCLWASSIWPMVVRVYILHTVQCPLTEILYALKQNKYVFLRELLKQCFVNSEIIQYKDSRNVEGT